jgi:nucleotidyltransferase substrate binding protein (TIGR01987 family)
MSATDKKISLQALLKAKAQLDFAIEHAKSELEITGAIKCFEYCFELSWKTMKKLLEVRGISDINSPRAVFLAAFQNKLIDNIEMWNSFIAQRNLTSHTYDQDLAGEVFSSLGVFSQYLDNFIKTAQKEL